MHNFLDPCDVVTCENNIGMALSHLGVCYCRCGSSFTTAKEIVVPSGANVCDNQTPKCGVIGATIVDECSGATPWCLTSNGGHPDIGGEANCRVRYI